jgi:hypothetical protein
VLPTVVGIAYAILLVGFLIGLYQAAMRGGDVQALAVTAIKYVVIAIIIANWATVFREVNTSFNSVADFITNSSGAGDMFVSWKDQLKQQFDSTGVSTLWSLITGGLSGLITVLMLLVSYVVYVVALLVFGFFYTLYGSVLYVLGPLVLALMPMAGVGQLAKSYATNLMIWNAWSVIYGILAALITAIHANDMNSLPGFMGFFTQPLDSLVLGLISVVYALAMMLIPMMAKRMVSGDVGAAAQGLIRAAMAAVSMGMSGLAGFSASASGSASAASTTGAGAGSTSATTASGAASSSQPPPVPSLAESMRANVLSAISGDSTAPKASADAARQNGSGSSGNQGHSSSGGHAHNGSGTADSNRGRFVPKNIAQVLAYRVGHGIGTYAHTNGNGNSKS